MLQPIHVVAVDVLLDHSNEPVLICDPSTGSVDRLNRAAEALYGLAPGSNGVPLVDLCTSSGPDQQRLREPDCTRWISRHRGRDGAEFDVEAANLPTLYKTRAMRQLTVRRLHPHGRSGTYEHAVATLALAIGHDLGGLATVVSGEARLLAEEAVGEDGEALRSIQNAAERIVKLTRLLQDLGGRKAGPPRPVAVGDVVRSSERVLSLVAGRKVSVQLDCADTWTVLADAFAIEQVLLNLVANARDSMSGTTGPGIIRVETRHEANGQMRGGDHVLLSVVDQGCGVAPGISGRIFEEFFTTKQGRRSGAGIGLSSARRTVEDAGGKIWAEPRDGGGTTFHVLLPRHENAASGRP